MAESNASGRARHPVNQGLYDHLENNLHYYEVVHDAGSVITAGLQTALSSLQKYPRPVSDIEVAKKLVGFDADVVEIASNYYKLASNPVVGKKTKYIGDAPTPSPKRHRGGVSAERRSSPLRVESPVVISAPRPTSSARRRKPKTDENAPDTSVIDIAATPGMHSAERVNDAERVVHPTHIDFSDALLLMEDEELFAYDDRSLSERLADKCPTAAAVTEPSKGTSDPAGAGKEHEGGTRTDDSTRVPSTVAAATAPALQRAYSAGRAEAAHPYKPSKQPAVDTSQWSCSACGKAWKKDASGSWMVDGNAVLAPRLSGWEIVLLLDNREVRSKKDRTYIQSQLLTRGVPCEIRQLPLGDFTWIARKTGVASAAPSATAAAVDATAKGKSKKTPVDDPKDHEYMLNYIVERKAVSDLASSLIDGRYTEQKLRLSASSQRVTYIVEGDPTKLNENVAYGAMITSKNILGAMASTSIMNDYNVVMTSTVDGSVAWITQMHQIIVQQWSNPPMQWCLPHVSDEALLSAAAHGLPAITSGGHAPADAMLLSQTGAQRAELHAEKTIWPIGRGRSNATPQMCKGRPHPAACTSDKCNLIGQPALVNPLQTYNEWCSIVSKPRSMCVLHIFGRMLRQVMGCGADKAQAILEKYPTPSALIHAYDSLRDRAVLGPTLLKGMPIPRQKNTLGPQLSSTLYDVFCVREYAGWEAVVAALKERASRNDKDGEDGEARALPKARSGFARGGMSKRGRGALSRAHSAL